MKKSNIILLGIIFLVIAFTYTACKKDFDDLQQESAEQETLQNNNHINASGLKSTVSDSLLCVRIEYFLDALKDQKSVHTLFDSASYYLEASVNYHYGRLNEGFESSLVDSFDVTIEMENYDYVTYGDAYDTRCDIIDSLKVIYDKISDTTKFMVFAMVDPIDHRSNISTYRVYAGFAWGDNVEYDEDTPYATQNSWHWESEAPQKIINAATSLYAYKIGGMNPGPGFFHDIAFRNWKWKSNLQIPNFLVYQSELSNYNGTSISHPPINNYMDYDSFWQQSDLFSPSVGIHTHLSGTEVNFYVNGVKSMIDKSYGHPGGGRVFTHMFIYPIEESDPLTGVWKYRTHTQVHYFGKPAQCAIQNYQLELYNWNW